MSAERQREIQLKDDDLGSVKLLLQPISAHWIHIADQLGMTSLVGEIQGTPSNKCPSDFLRDLLHRWLCRERPSPTLQTLCQALRGDDAITGGGNVAKNLEEKFQGQRADPKVENVHEIVKKMENLPTEERVSELIEERVKAIQQDKTHFYSDENIKFLNILKNNGKLERVFHLVTCCEVLVEKRCVKLIGTPEGCSGAEKEIDGILEQSKRMTKTLPEFVSPAVGKQATKCMEKNEGVLVLPDEEKIVFIAECPERCIKAIEWMREKAYPYAFQFKERGRFFLTTSTLSGDTPVVVEEVEALYYIVKLKQVIRGSLSRQSDTIREKLGSILRRLQPHQAHIKVGYEARFGHVLWKLNHQARGRRGRAGNKLTLDHFRNPHPMQRSVFRTRVHPDIENVLSCCLPVTRHDGCIISPVKLLDPLRLEVTRYDGAKVKCVAVIEEIEDTSGSRFILNNVFYDLKEKGMPGPQFDIVLPDRKYDVRIAPNFAPPAEQYSDDKQYEEVHKIADSFRSSIHRRSDKTLWMKVRGPNYRVTFLRQKKQTQYRWKTNEKWILAMYYVQQFEMKEIEDWPMDKEVQLPLEPPKTEVELWNQKRFGDFAPRAHFTKGQYAEVKSTADLQLPDEDTPCKGSYWTAEEMMKDFEEFLVAAVNITDLLTLDQ